MFPYPELINILTLPAREARVYAHRGLTTAGGGSAVSQLSSKPVSELLEKRQAGDANPLEVFIPPVYNELRRLGRRHLREVACRT
jgi:hypothetical protein